MPTYKQASRKQKPSRLTIPLNFGDFPDDPLDFIDNLSNPGSDTSSQLEGKGIYYITGEIEPDSLLHIHQDILLKHIDPHWQEDIQLIINSPGGAAPEGWALIDLLDYVRMDIRTTGIGCIASLGTMILAAGTPGKRSLMPSSSIMTHEVHLMIGPTVIRKQDLTAYEQDMRQEYQRTLDFWLRVSGLKTVSAVEKKLLGPVDHYFTPQEAVELGIADLIIGQQVPQQEIACQTITNKTSSPRASSPMTKKKQKK